MNDQQNTSRILLQPKVLINTENSKLWIVENFSPDLFSELQQLPLYEEPPIVIMGKQCNQRRNIGFFF